jgi:DNA-binding response OmpR family regulator
MKLLVIEDETQMAGFLHRGLTTEGHSVTLAPNGQTGLDLSRAQPFDFILLDVNLPDRSGFDVCTAMRSSGVDAPVIMVTARDDVPDRITGLTSGADDYLVKPFAFDELLARMNAIQRRMARHDTPSSKDAEILECGDLTFSRKTMSVSRCGHDLHLTVKELGILTLLMEAPDKVISRGEILQAVWDVVEDPLTNIVEVYMSRLRRKLHAVGPPCIENLRGFGYRLRPVW